MLIVIGLGNYLRGDDGIGPVIIQKLEEYHRSLQIKLVDAGSDAFTVLNYLLGSDPVLIIDCARMGEKPGTVQKIIPENTKFSTLDMGISLHGYHLAELWQIARSMGVKTRLSIIGIEPDAVEFNSGLSGAVEKSIPIILQMVEEEANQYAAKDTHYR